MYTVMLKAVQTSQPGGKDTPPATYNDKDENSLLYKKNNLKLSCVLNGPNHVLLQNKRVLQNAKSRTQNEQLAMQSANVWILALITMEIHIPILFTPVFPEYRRVSLLETQTKKANGDQRGIYEQWRKSRETTISRD